MYSHFVNGCVQSLHSKAIILPARIYEIQLRVAIIRLHHDDLMALLLSMLMQIGACFMKRPQLVIVGLVDYPAEHSQSGIDELAVRRR